MKEVRKRAPRKDIRPGRLCLLLAALTVAALGAVFLLRGQPETPPAPESAVKRVTLISRDANELTRIHVTPPSGEAYALIIENGEPTLEGDDDFVLHETRAQSLLTSAAHIEMEEALLDTGEETVDLAAFGLSPARAAVEITYTDGQTVALSLGDAIPHEALQYYCMAGGDDTLYAVSGEVWDAYSQERLFLHDVPLLDIQKDSIEAIAVAGEGAFSLALTTDGWYLETPRRYPADKQAMETLLTRLAGMRLSSFVCDASGAALAQYGLAPAARTLTLTGADAGALTLAFGNKASDTMVYCLYDGAVYQGTLFSMQFLSSLAPEALAQRSPVNYAVNVMTEFSLDVGSEKTVYSLSLAERVLENNEFETDENGNILYDVIVKKDGAAVDTDAFLNWYAQFAAISGTGALPDGYVLQGAPLATVTLKSESASREVAFYTIDALNVALAVNGEAYYYAQKPPVLAAMMP